MPGTCVVGLQWGDEAKGKLVDLLTPRHEIVVRYQGGANAGHTVVVGGTTYILHQIPSGILTPGVQNMITAGVVLHPPTVLKEIDTLAAQGVTVQNNLWIADRAHVVFPWHLEEDRLLSASHVEGEPIGTTLRGVGPCYRDKVGRHFAIRLGDLYRDDLNERIARIARAKQTMLAGARDQQTPTFDAQDIFREYQDYAARLDPYRADTTAMLLDAVDQDRRVLFEGAQGALLDIDHGTFPFVTSSSSSGVGVSAGAGVPGRWISQVFGVIKAYSTRVGGGPFPTELVDDIGEHIREQGREYGTTTGRARRCGWFDAVGVRYAARLSGVDTLALMMLDVLSQLQTLEICVAYEIRGRRVTVFPSHVDDLRVARPIYETLPGWQQDISSIEQADDLPENARDYIRRIEQLVGRPVGLVSVGPDRAQTIVLDPRLAESSSSALARRG